MVISEEQEEIRFFMGKQKVQIIPCNWHEGDEYSHGCPDDEHCLKIKALKPLSISRLFEDYDEKGRTGKMLKETHTYSIGEIFCCPTRWLWKKMRQQRGLL